MATVAEIKKKLKGYRYSDITARDAQSLTSAFRNLKVREIKPFIHSNGSTENMVAASGTIPVNISGTIYNIPITIWLRVNHPYQPPIVYVSPTNDMGIHESRFVDKNGLVYLPYISEWKNNTSDLPTLAQVLIATFAEHCPVYSKMSVPPQQPAQPGRWGQPHPQHPGFYGTTASFPTPQFPTQHRQPYPPAPGSYPPQPQPTPYPPGGQTPMPTPYASGPGYNYQPSSNTAQPPYPPQSQYGTVSYSQPSHLHQSHGPAGGLQSPPATMTAAPRMMAVPQTTPSAQEERQAIEEQERIERKSLETAVEDKIRRQVKQVLDAAQLEMDAMMKTQEKLKSGNKEITKMMADMSEKKREVEGSINILQKKKVELGSLLDYLRAQPDTVNVDEAVTATSPLYNQILRLYSEENAIDDTIYYLGEALRKEVIDLDAFLKHVRELSRQQFMARAKIMKARTAAGLAQHGVPT